MIDDPDELVSAYLDGQVTAEEAARVESDPELAALVDEMRAVIGSLAARPVPPIDPATRARHLDAALAAFDAAGRPARLTPAPIDHPTDPVDLTGDGTGHRGLVVLPVPGGPDTESAAIRAARARAATRLDGAAATDPASPRAATSLDEVREARAGARNRGGVPAWLRVAAAVTVMAGGAAFAASRLGGGGTSTATNAEAAGGNLSAASSTTTFPSRDGEAAKDAAGEASRSAAAAPSDSGTALPGVAASRAASGVATTAAPPPTTAAAPSAPPLTTATTGPLSTIPGSTRTTLAATSTTAATTTGGGVLSYAAVPSDATLSADVSRSSWQVPALASCGAAVSPPAGTSLVGWVPASVAGVAGQALVYRNGTGPVTVLLRQTATCQPF